MPVSGPDFISIQVSDLERSAAFYEEHLGLTRQPGPPHAVVFDTKPIAFALRAPVEGFNPVTEPRPSGGVGLWFHASDGQAIHDALATSGVSILVGPIAGPFGHTFTFADPDGYRITVHDRG
jgi:catechol 2,3-dioxygenase-like lactoylglutathione lyase family enzyme